VEAAEHFGRCQGQGAGRLCLLARGGEGQLVEGGEGAAAAIEIARPFIGQRDRARRPVEEADRQPILSAETARVMADGARPSRRAAATKLPCSATATKIESSSSLSMGLFQILKQIMSKPAD
jgi:hypothetical protein